MSKYSEILKGCNYIIKNYSYILDAYVTDIFALNQFNSLPLKWQIFLNQLSLKDIYEVFCLNKVTATGNVLPLNFLSLQSLCNFINLNNNKSGVIKSHTFNKVSEHPNVDIFRHLTPKKIHEVEILSKVIYSIYSTDPTINHVVDVGGGLGHLARHLSVNYNIPVTCIEGLKDNSDKAVLYDEKLKISNNRKRDNDGISLPNHKAVFLERNISSSQWNDIFKKDEEKKSLYLLNGLHCCGELAPTMIEIFCNIADCKALVLTSCCYHKMNRDSQPMSAICKKITKDTPITYTILESACYFANQYDEKLKLNLKEEFESQIFRSILQEILYKRNIIEKIGKIRMKYQKFPKESSVIERFKLYMNDMMKRLEIEPARLTTSEENIAYERILHNWTQVIITNCLRIMLGPVVEAFLLIDRSSYLEENGINAGIYQMFDNKISPRNLAIMAFK